MSEALPFLQDLKRNTLRSRKILVFFIAFSAFCFSAMTQMSMSMKELASESFAWMMIVIGLILAFMTLLLSLSSVLKANVKTITMMKAFGYTPHECSRAVLFCYRPVSYVGFAVGSAYQYLLLKLITSIVFAGYDGIPAYHFDIPALLLSFAAFELAYESILRACSARLNRLSIQSIMLN